MVGQARLKWKVGETTFVESLGNDQKREKENKLIQKKRRGVHQGKRGEPTWIVQGENGRETMEHAKAERSESDQNRIHNKTG